MNNQDPFRDHFKQLEGATIISYDGYLGADEYTPEGFPTFTVRLANGDHVNIEFSKDTEGNDGGFLFISEPLKQWTQHSTKSGPFSSKKFEPGKVYWARSIGDHNCIFKWKVIRRTDKSIWINELGRPEVKRRSIKVGTRGPLEGVEWCLPQGVFSMCPTMYATREEGGA
jgi:hypothetical protein